MQHGRLSRAIPILVFASAWVAVLVSTGTDNDAWLHRLPGSFFTFIGGMGALSLAIAWWQRARVRKGYETLVASDTWEASEQPVDLSDDFLSSTRTCPAGDRKRWADLVAERDLEVAVDGTATPSRLGAFRWQWEARSRDSDGGQSYQRQRRVVGAVRLPVDRWFPHVAITPEGTPDRSRIGGRAQLQVDSEEFNGQFQVEVDHADRAVADRLLDPAFQAMLLERFEGRHVELAGDALLVGGHPDRHDGTHFGISGWYDALADDVAALVGAIPATFWRALAHR